jgi:hypothetical protein
MLKSGSPFFLTKVKRKTMKIQGEKAKIQGENLVQSGECELCFYGHKNLAVCSGCTGRPFPQLLNDPPL